MYQLILLIHVLVAIILVGLVLIQHGKGADIGASFGSGASNTVFGSQGTGSFLFKFTGALAVTFFLTSVTLSYMVGAQYKHAEQGMILQKPVPSIPLPPPGPVNGEVKK
jgi:preprotein translocase subunit SecG